MRHITQEGFDLIKRFEGFSPTIYICPAGYQTIGYGHVVRENERDQLKSGIDEQQAEEILRRDITLAERGVLRLIDVPLSDSQFSALVSFTFNLGVGALQRSTLRQKVNREEHHEVPREFMRWTWAGGRRLKGLERRRNAEAELYGANNVGSGNITAQPR